MSEAQPTSPVSPEADNSGDIYNPVLRTIAQSEQRAALVPGLADYHRESFLNHG